MPKIRLNNDIEINFNQENPLDQAICVLGATEGWVDNLKSGVSNIDVAIPKIEVLINQLRVLLPLCSKGTW